MLALAQGTPLVYYFSLSLFNHCCLCYHAKTDQNYQKKAALCAVCLLVIWRLVQGSFTLLPL